MKFMRWLSVSMLMLLLLAACGGGVEDTTIPAPPNGTQVQQGEDPIVDTLTSSVGSAVDPVAAEEGMTISNTTTYKSTDSFDNIVNFYKTEMTSRGWTEETAQTQAGASVLGYVSGNDGAIILIMDGSSFGSDNIVMTMNMSK